MPRTKARKKNISRKKPLSDKDLFRLKIPTAISLSPDESKIAYALERIDADDNKYYTNLHLLDIKSGEDRQFTNGKHNDGLAVWSPDGSQIAFVSTRDKKTGIYVMPAGGGAEREVKQFEGSVADLQWTPDGQDLVFCLRYRDSHFVKDEKKKKEPPVYRHITRFFFRLDAAGYLPSKDTFQVYRMTVATGDLKRITKGKRDNGFATLSPDGKWIAYISNRAKDPDLHSALDDLFVIPADGGRERKIPTPPGPKFGATFSPDSKTIAYIAHDNPEDGWGIANMHVWKVGLTGRPKARDLMPQFDRMAYDQSITDTGEGTAYAPLAWSRDGKRIYFLSSDTGVTNLFYVPAAGGKPTRVYRGKCHVRGFALNGKTKTAAMVIGDLTNPGEIYSSPASYGAEKRTMKHTAWNDFLRTEIKLGRTRDIMFKSFDGTEVQGWLVYPPNFKSTRKYPSILEVHGGPRVQYAYSFMHEMQYLAAQGYVVFYTNPRGGSGRGETWAEAIAGGWGDLDYKDVMAAADHLEKQKYINSTKMGITGGSYGGYMTNWVIGHTDRFRAAVTQRSVVDLKSFTGSSDIGFELRREFGGWWWDVPENYEKCSPITYFKNVKTPVLIIHSEQDLRCHHEQAEQMFVMLKALGKKVEMVLFPGEPHGLSRHGRPDRRIARLEWMAKWFGKYLKK